MRDILNFTETVANEYTGQSCEVTIDRKATVKAEGQGIAWRSLYSIIMALSQKQTPSDLTMFRSCLRQREREPGLPGNYCRKPGDVWVRNAHDDLTYAAVASMMLEPDRATARAILAYGRTHEWHFNTIFPDVQDPDTWQARHFYFVPLIKTCAGERIEWYERLILAVSLLFTTECAAGGVLMGWVQLVAMKKTGGMLCDLAASSWLWFLKRNYPGGMAGVCFEYFGGKSPDHPFTWPEVWAKIEQGGIDG